MDLERQKLARAAFDRLTQLAEDGDESGVSWLFQLTRHCVGLFWFVEHELVGCGSGILVQYNGRKFVMTCSHTLREVSEHSYFVLYYGQRELEPNGKRFIARICKLKSEERERELQVDVGAALLTDEAVNELLSAQKSFLELSGGSDFLPTVEEPCIIVGFPYDLMEEFEVTKDEDGVFVVTYEPTETLVEAAFEQEAASVYSSSSRSLIPEHHDHRFQTKAIKNSGRWRSCPA